MLISPLFRQTGICVGHLTLQEKNIIHVHCPCKYNLFPPAAKQAEQLAKDSLSFLFLKLVRINFIPLKRIFTIVHFPGFGIGTSVKSGIVKPMKVIQKTLYGHSLRRFVRIHVQMYIVMFDKNYCRRQRKKQKLSKNGKINCHLIYGLFRKGQPDGGDNDILFVAMTLSSFTS